MRQIPEPPESLRPRVAIVWRGGAGSEVSVSPPDRLLPVFEALGTQGAEPIACPFAEERIENVRSTLLGVEGVLAWVDPV